MALPSAWRPRPCPDFVRLGAPHDGGYVLPLAAATAADHLVSMGLSTDWSFEKSFHDVRSATVTAFDHTVTWDVWVQAVAAHVYKRRFAQVFDWFRFRRFFAQPGVEHRRLAIGYDLPHSRTLAQVMDEIPRAERVGLKVDIEGWEYRILDQVVAARDRLEFVVMELHDLDLMRERVVAFVNEMEGFEVVWMHGNNLGGLDDSGDPIVVEITLVPQRYVGEGPGPSASEITTPNNVTIAETPLTFA